MKFDLTIEASTIINDVSTIDNIGQFSIAIGNLIKGDSGKSPYIDETTKTWWEYNDTTKEYEDTGIAAKSVDIYNITNEIPLGAGLFYTLSTAIAATPVANRKKGLLLMFESAAGIIEAYQFKSIVANWTNQSYWEIVFKTGTYGSNLVSNFDTISKSGWYTGYSGTIGQPDNSGTSWFILHENSAVGIASAYQIAVAFSTTMIMWFRIKQASVWGAWENISPSLKIDKTAVSLYNITNEIPLPAGSYYTLATAIAAIPANIRKLGLKITFQVSATNTETWEFFNGTIGNITNVAYWRKTDLDLKIDKTSIVQDFGNDETKVMSQKSITEALANNYWYGIEWDVTVNTSACTRIGNMDLHRTLPIQSKFVGCLVNKDTTFNRFLPKNSWVGEILDGSAGQVMGRLVGFYYKVEEEGNIRRYKMSELPLPGFIYQPASFVGAYEASMNNVTGELSSVMNVSPDYRGGNNDATKDTLDNTLLGRPRTYTRRADYRIAARKINAGDTRWNILDKQRDEVISLLAYVEYANRNLQLPYNGALDANGFKQGGLGSGVTNLNPAKWSNWNGSNPFIPCGYTNSLGNNSGEIAYTMPFGYDASGLVNYKGEYDSLTAYVNGNYISQGQLLYKCIADAIAGTAIENTNYFTLVTRTVVYVNKYRAVEIPYGHTLKNLDQVIVDIKSANDNGGVASSKIYVCNDPKNYADTITSNYVYAGDLPLTSGYVKDVQMGENANLAPKETGAGATTHWADYHDTDVGSSSLRVFYVGDNSASGEKAGFRCSYVNRPILHISSNLGARLCLILKNEIA